jgi:hypothetical protein
MFGVASLVMFLFTIVTFIQTIRLGESPMENQQINLESREQAHAQALAALTSHDPTRPFIVALDSSETTITAVVSGDGPMLVNTALDLYRKAISSLPSEARIGVTQQFLTEAGLSGSEIGAAATLALGDNELAVKVMAGIIDAHRKMEA